LTKGVRWRHRRRYEIYHQAR